MTEIKIQHVEPKTKIINIEEKFMDTPIAVQILKMKDCIWVYIGPTTNSNFTNLTTSINSKYVSLK